VKLYLRILREVKRYWRPLVVSILFTVMFTATDAASMWMVLPLSNALFSETPVESDATPGIETPEVSGDVGSWLDERKADLRRLTFSLLAGESRFETIGNICLAIVVLFVMKNLFLYLHSFFIVIVNEGVIRDFRMALFERLQRLSLHFFHAHRGGELISRVTNDVGDLNAAVDISFSTLVRAPLMIVAYLGFAILVSWRLTLFIILLLPVTLFLTRIIGRFLRKYATRTQERMADLVSTLSESIYGARIVRAFSAEERQVDRFRGRLGAFYKATVKRARVRALTSPVNEMIAVVVGVLVLWYGSRQVFIESRFPPDEFVLYVVAMFSLLQPIKALTQVHNRIQEGLAAAERVYRVLDTVPRVQDGPEAIDLPPVREEVRFDHVCFRYDVGDVVVQDVSFSANAGETTALVGPSGGGKSTLLDLVARFYDPQDGTVLIDDLDVRRVSVESLRGALGIVTQETILFNDTVASNIAFGRPDATREDIVQATVAAFAHDFIEEMPDGYDTLIGDRGTRLSGGQRQRIAIARAILRDPSILIFDEATSALDTEAERQVQAAIDNLLSGRTAIVVAHRLSTVRRAHKIIVVEKGRVVEQGTHDELYDSGGSYRRLYDMQFAD
jgi:ABC-type multidrug transport system fused ATPase/permease subunit